MEFFNQFLTAPDESYLDLLRLLLILCFSISMPYLGVVIAATAVSVGFNTRDRDIPNATFARVAKDLMDMVASSKTPIVVLGVLPMVVMWVIYGQWLYESNATVAMSYMPIGMLLTAGGLTAAYLYRCTLYRDGRNSQTNVLLGAIAAKTLLLGTYVLIASIVRINDPERWHLMHNPLRHLLSFNIIWKHMFFVHGGAALLGAGILYFFFDWSGPKPEMDDRYAAFLRKFGAGLAMAMLTALPVLGFFYMVTTPHLAKSSAVFNVAAIQCGLFFVLFLMLLRVLKGRKRLGQPVFLLFLAVLALTAFSDQATLVNATREHTAKLITEAEAAESLVAMEREAARGDEARVDVARGEEVFNTVCATCHRMDVKLVGPAYKDVLPKYKGKMDELVAFIQKPTKVDPDFPPMPAPGISLGDAKSVAAFLLGEDPNTSSGSQDTGH